MFWSSPTENAAMFWSAWMKNAKMTRVRFLASVGHREKKEESSGSSASVERRIPGSWYAHYRSDD
jgi:hypothetical protein